MVFEQFLESDEIKRHTLFIFLLGVFYVLLGYAVAAIFFPGAVSVAMLFVVTLTLTPSIFVILGIEEQIEAKQGTRHFFHNHKDIFKIYLALFIGIFATFLVTGLFFQSSVFDYQMNWLETRGDLGQEVIEDFQEEYERGLSDYFNLISYTAGVAIIAFVLSIFYGAGALFLIVFNASVFAAFVTTVGATSNNPIMVILLFLIHLVPEIAGFLVAAISGGVISRAIMHERFRSKGFRNVMKDALILLFIAIVLIAIAAALELFVTAPLVRGVL